MLLAASGASAQAAAGSGHLHAGTTASEGAEAPFLSENDTAMQRMMADMAVAPTGDVDRDFLLMMIPHHQGAVDMALSVLRHGRDEKVRRLAHEIIVTQRAEIEAMTRMLRDLPPASGAAGPGTAAPNPASRGGR